MKSIALATLAALLLAAIPSAAQVPAPGDAVRVTYRIDASAGPRVERVRGTLVAREPDAVRLSIGRGGGAVRAFDYDHVVQLEVPTGRSRSAGAGKGALWGGAAGAIFGLLVVGLCAADDSSWFQCGGSDFLWGAATFGGMGAGAGALVGAAVGSEQWSRVPARPVPVATRLTETPIPPRDRH